MKIIVFLLLISFNILLCQNLGLSIYTNPYYSKFTKTNVDFRFNESSNINYGISLNFNFNRLHLEIGFVEPISLKQEYFSEDYIGDGIRSIDISYMKIPILIKYNILEKRGYDIFPIVGINKIINYSIDDNIDDVKGNESGSLIYNYADIQYSFILGIGMQKMIIRNLIGHADYLFSQSFQRLQKKEVYNYGNPFIRTHGLRIGLQYNFINFKKCIE